MPGSPTPRGSPARSGAAGLLAGEPCARRCRQRRRSHHDACAGAGWKATVGPRAPPHRPWPRRPPGNAPVYAAGPAPSRSTGARTPLICSTGTGDGRSTPRLRPAVNGGWNEARFAPGHTVGARAARSRPSSMPGSSSVTSRSVDQRYLDTMPGDGPLSSWRGTRRGRAGAGSSTRAGVREPDPFRAYGTTRKAAALVFGAWTLRLGSLNAKNGPRLAARGGDRVQGRARLDHLTYRARLQERVVMRPGNRCARPGAPSPSAAQRPRRRPAASFGIPVGPPYEAEFATYQGQSSCLNSWWASSPARDGQAGRRYALRPGPDLVQAAADRGFLGLPAVSQGAIYVAGLDGVLRRYAP